MQDLTRSHQDPGQDQRVKIPDGGAQTHTQLCTITVHYATKKPRGDKRAGTTAEEEKDNVGTCMRGVI